MSVRWARTIERLSDARQAAADGFDSAQAALGLLAELTDEQLGEHKRALETSGFKIDVCATPLPPEARVTERGFNIYVWTEYLKKAVRRAADFGCGVIAWSEGRSRVLPLEGDTIGAREQVLQFLAMLSEVSSQYGIKVLVEPLGPRRTNFLNSMEEVADFLPLVGKENLSSVVSLRELSEIGFGNEDFDSYAHLIAHVQMENPQEVVSARKAPRADDGQDYRPFVEALRRIHYDGVITLPQNADAESLDYCRMLWAQG